MTLLSLHEPVVDRGLLARANPLATLGAAFAAGTLVALTSDPLTPAVALALELVALAAGGVPLRLLVTRGWPLLLSAGGVGLTVLLLGSGEDPLRDAGATVARVLAVALPGVVVLLAVDPTRLADALVQHGRVPVKFAYGALAALRLLPLLSAEWRSAARARRARGLDAGRDPVAAVRIFAGQVLTLLVAAVRRGTRLATAMEARGFDPDAPRSIARPQRFTGTDTAVLAAGPLLAAAAMTASAVAGALVWVWS